MISVWRFGRRNRQAAAVLIVLAVVTFAPGCGEKKDAASHHVTLGDWTFGSLTFATCLATDSAPLADGEPPLTIEPSYRADTVFYGLIQSYVGDPHGGRHIVRDRDSLGRDVFHFDANNNEDLTDDGPPLTWQIDSTDSLEWIDLACFLPDGGAFATQFIAGGSINEQISATIGRPALDYAVRSNTAREGVWVVRQDSLLVEFYAFQRPNPGNDSLGNWFVLIDVNRDGIFDPQPPDLLISSADPSFEFDSLLWRVSIDPAADGITLTSEPIEDAPSAEGEVVPDGR
jgi:hypothetical protein